MTNAYLNYPNPHMTLHRNSACAEIGKMHKAEQRNLKIDQTSFSQAFNQLTSLQLGSQASVNDVWLTINFKDTEFEQAVAEYVCRFLSLRYGPLKDASVEKHC